MYAILWDHLLEHAPISDRQLGFQRGKSTTTALLSATHDWFSLLDRQCDVLCVFFDFRNAFDSVPHKKLLEKLSRIGFLPNILSWLCSYVSDRKQYVLVNGEHSTSTLVRSGVPQGSVLGPLLFLHYTNDLTNRQKSTLSLYADDMLLYKPITSDISYVEMQQDINCLFQWSQENMLSFNITKCKCILLTNKRNIPLQTITLNNQPLQYVQHYKYLGVTVSHNLSWTQHIHDICKKARRVLGTIYHRIMKNTNDSRIILRLYTTLVRPHPEYAAQVWNPHLEKDIRCLEKVQQFALRMCAKDYHAIYENLLLIYFLYHHLETEDYFCHYALPITNLPSTTCPALPSTTALLTVVTATLISSFEIS